MLNLQQLNTYTNQPSLFERGAPMWHDPYIATQMLAYHLDQSHDIASRRTTTIDKIVQWLVGRLNPGSGMSLLDLGCGPGLYTRRFAQHGIQTTGVDYSSHSIDYARQNDPATTYICQNYVDLDLPDNSFDIAIMVYGDFCVLSNEERDNLLAKVHQMLKPGGHFVFDVTTPQVHRYLANHRSWSVEPDGGFWKPEPYLVLEQGYLYTEDVTLEQFVVITGDGTLTLYRNWYRDYTPETITPIVTAHHYEIVDIYADLMGTPYTEDSDWCGIVARCRK